MNALRSKERYVEASLLFDTVFLNFEVARKSKLDGFCLSNEARTVSSVTRLISPFHLLPINKYISLMSALENPENFNNSMIFIFIYSRLYMKKFTK